MTKKTRYRKLKRILFVIVVVLAAFFIYVEVANRNSRNMTYRQKVLKAVYPAWMWWAKLWGKNTRELSNDRQQPRVSFYSLSAILNNGDTLDFNTLKGKKVLLVNTASDCGYTGQYAELQKLFEEYRDNLVILAFPANDFRGQEKGTDEAIAQFCKSNYGISFPLLKKSTVIKTSGQHPVYQWLTDPARNGWNSQAPTWNFSKYLVSEQGLLTHFFGPTISPQDKDIAEAIAKQ